MDLIVEPKKIAISYLKGSFWIDFMSTVPLDTITLIFTNKANADKFKLFGILKLIRLVRLNRLITGLHAERRVKTILKIIKLTFFLMLYVHCQGCVWYFVVKQDQLWIPPVQYIETSLTANFIWTMPLIYQYWMAIYTSLLMLMGNDILP